MLQVRRVVGHEAVLAYWRHQFATIDPTVEPLAVRRLDDGRVDVAVHQVVRDVASGAVLADQTVHHVYELRDGRVRSMEVVDDDGRVVSAPLGT